MKQDFSQILPLLNFYQQGYSPEAKLRQRLLASEADFQEGSLQDRLAGLNLGNQGLEQNVRGATLGNDFAEQSMASRLQDLLLRNQAGQQGIEAGRQQIDTVIPAQVAGMNTQNSMAADILKERGMTQESRLREATMGPQRIQSEINANSAQVRESDARVKSAGSEDLRGKVNLVNALMQLKGSGQQRVFGEGMAALGTDLPIARMFPQTQLPDDVSMLLSEFNDPETAKAIKLDPENEGSKIKWGSIYDQVREQFPQDYPKMLPVQLLEFINLIRQNQPQ